MFVDLVILAEVFHEFSKVGWDFWGARKGKDRLSKMCRHTPVFANSS